MDINEALTRRVADLARLELTDQEAVTFTAQLKQILGYVETLNQVDVSRGGSSPVEPLTHPLDLNTPLRDDVARPFGLDDQGKPKVLGSAPEVFDDGFKVPQIL